MSTAVAKEINLTETLENCQIGPLQIRVFTLCMLCLIMDGFDVQAMGYTAPSVLKEFGIGGVQLGYLFAAANTGVLLGSLLFSPLADKIGRRPVLVVSTFAFSILTLMTAYAQTFQQLLWLRLISGIGLGCIMPNATALVGEYSPKRSRVMLMMNITVGFTAGGALGGFVAAWLIPQFGWRSVFIFGGAVPFVIAIAMLTSLPESLQFLAVRRRRLDQLARWLTELDSNIRVDSSTKFVASEQAKEGFLFSHLFQDGRSAFTMLLWVVNFMNIMVLYSLSNWLATVVTGMGYTQQTAVLVSTVLQVGGTIGSFGLAWLITRGGFVHMLIATFGTAAVTIAFIGHPAINLTVLFVLVFIAGWCIVGGQPGINALSATYYPTYLRTTGVGAGLGVGRAGAILGPIVGGYLVAQQFSPQQLFWAAAVPALISTITMLVMRGVISPELGVRKA